MIFLNLIKLDDEIWIEIREYLWKEDSKMNPQYKKSLNLDEDSRRNHRMNKREISEK